MNDWIVDWSLIDDQKTYIVAPICSYGNGEFYLAGDLHQGKGWQVKRLRGKCYAALEMPAFDPATVKS